MKTDYCQYPPRIAADVEIVEQRDEAQSTYIVGSTSAARYALLRETEYKVFNLIDQADSAADVCARFERQFGGKLSIATLSKFLAKLDQSGILAGERSQAMAPPSQQLSQAVYLRFKLFDPGNLFARMIPSLRWIWTTRFVAITAALMAAAVLSALVNPDEVAQYGNYILRERWPEVFIASWLVIVSHEFAHGLTCKAFGGRVSEIGVLMLYYVLPGMYCNVSGLHLIPQPNRRLWVIAAGIYWQLLVGTAAYFAWKALAPYTLLSDLAFVFFLGSILNIVFNANPLIKLDGYYFLSQLLRMPNLMDRSRAYWRVLLEKSILGKDDRKPVRLSNREKKICFVFGLLSFLYTLGLRCAIVLIIGRYLIDGFYLLGLAMTAAIAIFYMRHPLGRIFRAVKNFTTNRREAAMSKNDQKNNANGLNLRRWVKPLTAALLLAGVLIAPWSASVGNYGALIAVPGQETIIFAPESGALVALNAQTGGQIAKGGVVGQMGNFDLEEQIVQVESELARVNADYDRLLAELRVRNEASAQADLQLKKRERDFNEVDAERRQIERRLLAESSSDPARLTPVSMRAASTVGAAAASYPAALAVLQSEADALQATHNEAVARRDRMRALHADGITPRSELDAAETQATTTASALTAARERLEAALTEHRRKHYSVTADLNIAGAGLSIEKMQAEKMMAELSSTRTIIQSLEERKRLLLQKRSRFELVSPQSGVVFGEDLSRKVGGFFQKGAEICRVAATDKLLVRLQVPEREIGDVRLGHPVRLKALSYPDRIFRGTVSRIGGEGESDQNRQTTYRVELLIENSEGLLRPGMTAFARIDFDRRMIGAILIHKIKRALRPELWML